jgi:hypothetical protein
MLDIAVIAPILLISLFGFIAFKDWSEMELDWQAKKFIIKRRKIEYLQPNSPDTPADKSSPRQLPKE